MCLLLKRGIRFGLLFVINQCTFTMTFNTAVFVPSFLNAQIMKKTSRALAAAAAAHSVSAVAISIVIYNICLISEALTVWSFPAEALLY